MSKNSSNLVIYSPVNRYNKPQLATKSLIINRQGERDKISHFKTSYRGFISVKSFSTFDEFSKLLNDLESNPHAFIVRGSVLGGIDLNKPQARRKDLAKWTEKGQGHTVAFKEADEGWIGFDIDKMPLSKLGINQPIHELDIPYLIRLLIDTYVPEFSNVSCHYQLSSSCGWTDSTSLSCHLFFVPKNPISNPKAKDFAKAVNERAGFGLFDTALYQAVQPHFTAAPLIQSPAVDPIAGKRSGQLRYDNDYLDLNIDELLLERPERTPHKPTQKTTRKRVARKNKPQATQGDKPKKLYKPQVVNIATFDGWLQALERTDSLHETMLTFSNWVYGGKFWGLSEHEEKKVVKALKKSPRIKREPTRLESFFRDNEYKDLMDSARDRQLHKRLERFKAGQLQADITQHTRWFSFDYDLDIKPLGKKINLLIAPMANGKTTWLKNTLFGALKDYQSFDDTSIVITHRRILSKKLSIEFRIDDYEIFKLLSLKQKENNPTFNLSVCLNSLTSEGITTFLPGGGDLIIDECEAVFHSIFSNLIKPEKRTELLNLFKILFEHSKRVFLSQHNISELTLKFLAALGFTRDDVGIFENTYQRYDGLPVFNYEDDEQQFEKLLKTLKSCKAYIATNSIKQSKLLFERLQKACPDKKGILLHSENTKELEQAKLLKNPTQVSKEYDYIIATPVLEMGNSIENPEYKTTFGFFNSQGGNTPSGCTQMLFRNREVKQIYYSVDAKQKSEASNKDLMKEAAARWLFTQRGDDMIKLDEYGRFKGVEYDENARAEIQLQFDVIAKENKDKQDFIGNLYAELKQGMACNVQLVSENAQKEVKAETKANKTLAKKEVKAVRKVEILQAPRITDDQYQISVEKNQQVQECSRYAFEKVMRVDVNKYPPIPVDTKQGNVSEQFEQYENDNPEIAQALKDYDDGAIKRKHLFLSEACTPLDAAKAYALYLKPLNTKGLKQPVHLSFVIRYSLYRRLLPLVGLRADNWGLKAIEEFEFRYKDIIENKPFMAFCRKNKDALNASGLTRFNGVQPTEKTLGYWLRNLGLSPKLKSVGVRSEQVQYVVWDSLDVPTVRLLKRYNSIQDEMAVIDTRIVDQPLNPVAPAVSEIDALDNEFSYINNPDYVVYSYSGCRL